LHCLFTRKYKGKKSKNILNGGAVWPKCYDTFNRYALTRAQYCWLCELRTPPKGHVVAEPDDALLAVDYDSGQAPTVVVVATERRKLENDLPKQQKSWAVDCPHTPGYMESSTKQYVRPALAGSAVLRLQRFPSTSGS
jgi:hypothetical protein